MGQVLHTEFEYIQNPANLASSSKVRHTSSNKSEIRGAGENGQIGIWIGQLVVGARYRKQGIATNLLRHVIGACCRDSGEEMEVFAVGLATSHPYTVKALETAGGRRCDRVLTAEYADDLIKGSAIPYLQDRKTEISRGEEREKEEEAIRCVVDTEFLIDHTMVDGIRKGSGDEWKLGDLKDGEEFLAIVFL